MKIKYLKIKNWFLVTLMGAMGFSSCHSNKELAEPQAEAPTFEDNQQIRLMYGVPSMNFMIRGQVRDAEGRPVRDIRVNMLDRGMEVKDGELQGDPENVQRYLENTSVRTDDEGRFTIQNNGLPQQQVRLLVRDVDGKENGEFGNKVVDMKVEADDVDRTDANGWHQGTYNKEVDIELENK
ncbi:MAG: radical SAM-associated putative lipoprotein [Bacteroidales bacterium]|nr:radical SAM-associated putative lipoprotein [Bacteroidales bacterium]